MEGWRAVLHLSLYEKKTMQRERKEEEEKEEKDPGQVLFRRGPWSAGDWLCAN